MKRPPRPFAPVPLSVLSRRDLDACDKVALAGLILRADENGQWRGTHDDLMLLLGASEKSVKGSLRKLREVGYLASKRVRWGTAYSLNMATIQSVQTGGFIPSQKGLNKKSHSGPIGPVLSIKNPIKNPYKKRKRL